MSKVINSIKEYLQWLAGGINQIDCPDEVDIETSNNPDDKQLKEALLRIDNMEKEFNKKGTGSGKSVKQQEQIVETVVIDPKVVTELAKKSQEKQAIQRAQGNEQQIENQGNEIGD